ncbi:hypothetical protein L8R73_17960 [Enterobacter bugandensis]|nr:hypothetical protein [Enterobacter bugandensis]MCK6811536.1 hypothetical protein [Enterobacter bugandensis]MCK7197295.1 hypothetical protein [Enterobacter bugandensis]MCK7207434.1 hypothetical protein [Enterobacter bugandensis]
MCGTFHDVGREYPCFAKNPRTSRHKNDYALCISGTRSPGNCAAFQSTGNTAKWRQSGGSGWHYPAITTTNHDLTYCF